MVFRQSACVLACMARKSCRQPCCRCTKSYKGTAEVPRKVSLTSRLLIA